jgi:hypothetical protein
MEKTSNELRFMKTEWMSFWVVTTSPPPSMTGLCVLPLAWQITIRYRAIADQLCPLSHLVATGTFFLP